jgi:nicotinamidase-related amidase
MDVQRAIVDRYADTDPGYLPRLRAAIDAARSTGLPVIYVVVGLRPGFPEVSARNKAFSALRQGGGLSWNSETAQIHPAVAPGPDEIVVSKKRVSAFAGSDLDLVLRAGDIDSLILAGIATSGVVLSTLRQAADLDLALTVLADGCLDADPEVHRVLTGKVFPRQAEVVTIDEWVKAIGASMSGDG